MFDSSVWIGVSVATGIAIIIPLRKYIQGGQFNKPTKITNKVVIITGGNTGIGKETALDLASRGAKVYLACRHYERGEAARLEIIAITGNENVFNRKLDLSSFDSIKMFAKEFQAEEQKLDILINNAAYAGPRQLTTNNLEMNIGVNHLGHFLLTNLLLDNIKKASPSRIVVVSSMAHQNGTINREDFNSEHSYSGLKAYSQSKLANVLFTRSLAKRLDGSGVVVNSLHPGAVDTEIYRNVSGILSPLINFVKWVFFKTSKSGAQTQIRLAVDPDLENVTRKYFSDCEEKECSEAAKDDETAEWLFNKSEELTGVKY